jgi:hypothetical protein
VSWQARFQQMVLAGGVLATGCNGMGNAGTCGNASPDPCICDRPSSSSAAAQACSEKTSCENTGGLWSGGTGEWGAGGTCVRDSGTTSPDGSAADDGGGSRG